MKLIEVIFLTGAHCVSPIMHTAPMTEVFKVQCAVVVVKDTVAGTLSVMPASEAGNPRVIEVVSRFKAPEQLSGITSQPEPSQPESQVAPLDREAEVPSGSEAEAAAGTTGQPLMTEFKARPGVIGTNTFPNPLPEAEADAASAEPAPSDVATAEEETATAEEETVSPKAKSPPRKAKRTKKQKAKAHKKSSVCSGSTKQVWYTNAEGRRKYRCVHSNGPQLY